MIESLLSSNTSNRFKTIVTPTRGKNLWPPLQNGTIIHNFRKTKDCRQHALVTYTFFLYKQSIFDPRPENCLSFSKKFAPKIV